MIPFGSCMFQDGFTWLIQPRLLVKAVIPSWIQYLKQQQKQERISPFPKQFLEVVVL